jgi:hypothetical protein
VSTDINASNVATLKQKWTFKLSYDGGLFGEFAGGLENRLGRKAPWGNS